MTKIEWTEKTWNPVVGCSPVSPGCTNCYAARMAHRIQAMKGWQGTAGHYEGTTKIVNGRPVWTGKIAIVDDHALIAPLRRKKPVTYFVNSMGDLFHENVPEEWINRVFAVMAMCPQHCFQLLTKWPARMREYFAARTEGDPWAEAADYAASAAGIEDHPFVLEPRHIPLPNVWLGVSCEDQKRADERVPDLLAVPAAIRFVSCEPMLGAIDFTCLPNSDGIGEGQAWLDALTGWAYEKDGDGCSVPGLDWVICGGESGPSARPMHPEWPRLLRDHCQLAEVPFFFKQHGEWISVPDLRRLPGGKGPGFGAFDYFPYDQEHETICIGKKRAGRLLDGRTWDETPSHEPRQ